jgi:hypothetical protein
MNAAHSLRVNTGEDAANNRGGRKAMDSKIVLTVISPDGDKTFRSFPFSAALPGSREAAEERLTMALHSVPRGSGVLWEVKEPRRQMVEA